MGRLQMRAKLAACVTVMVLALAGVGLMATPALAAAYPAGCAQTAYFRTQDGTAQWCWIGTNNSTYDRYSDYTVMAQRILARDGWYSGAIDGDFGPMTATSVRSYQSNRGLYVDGIIGGATWTKLMFTSISWCGIINFGYASFDGFRINAEACGGDIQRAASERTYVRAYNKLVADPYNDSIFTVASLSGPTALP